MDPRMEVWISSRSTVAITRPFIVLGVLLGPSVGAPERHKME